MYRLGYISRLSEPHPLLNNCDLGSDCRMGQGRGRQCGVLGHGRHGGLAGCNREERGGGGRGSGEHLYLASQGLHCWWDSPHTPDQALAELGLCLWWDQDLH